MHGCKRPKHNHHEWLRAATGGGGQGETSLRDNNEGAMTQKQVQNHLQRRQHAPQPENSAPLFSDARAPVFPQTRQRELGHGYWHRLCPL